MQVVTAKCDQCGNTSLPCVQMDYRLSIAWYCLDCLRAAVQMLEPNDPTQEVVKIAKTITRKYRQRASIDQDMARLERVIIENTPNAFRDATTDPTPT